jgi:hypothetical protein
MNDPDAIIKNADFQQYEVPIASHFKEGNLQTEKRNAEEARAEKKRRRE